MIDVGPHERIVRSKAILRNNPLDPFGKGGYLVPRIATAWRSKRMTNVQNVLVILARWA